MTRPLLATTVEGAAAFAAGLALASLLEPGDAFRGSLAILPAVVAALRAIERHAVARRTPPFEGRIAAVVLVGLVAATLARQRLGLAATDWFLAAGFLLLLGQRAARLALALRPCLKAEDGSSRRLPRRPSAAFFWLPFVVYVAIQPWTAGHRQPDGDEPFYLLVTHSLANDLDLDLANNYAAEDWRRFMDRAVEPQIGDPVGPAGEQYSRHSFLLPLVLAPAYLAAGRAGAMAAMAALTAALAWMLLRLARHYAPRQPGAALAAYAVLAFSPPLLLYSGQIWVEVPAALLVALALDGIAKLGHSRRWEARGVVALALPLVLLPVLKLRLALLAVTLCLLALWRARPPVRNLKWLAAGLAAAAAALIAFNQWRFDNPLRLYSWNELDLFRHPPFNFVRGGAGMFYDCAFGLFLNAPIWLLLLPALGLALRRRSTLLADAAIVALPYLIFVAPRVEWYGGWSPPFRYPLVFLPLLALFLVPLLQRRSHPAVRALIVAFGAATLVLTLLWLAIPGWTYNFADGRTHLLDAAGARLEMDVARFFPSTVRPRPATWVWIAASLLLIPAGALIAGPRRRAGPGPSRGSPSWAVAALLLLLSSLPVAGGLIPTREVHLEDGFVGKYLGSIHPPPWTLRRPIYPGGWAVPAGGGLVAPVTPGGERVTITVTARLDAGEDSAGEGTGRLVIGSGNVDFGSWQVGPEWTEETLGPFDWPAGGRLVIRGDEALSAPVIVDRAEMLWH